jgi:hypothetical protein
MYKQEKNSSLHINISIINMAFGLFCLARSTPLEK